MRWFTASFLVGLVVLLSADVQASGCKPGQGCGTAAASGAPQGCGPHWCDSYANLRPWPFDNFLYDSPRNWQWWYPHGGFTAYPGLPGSGIRLGSDYSHINWVTSPVNNAQLVTEKLKALGIPTVPQETIFLGKNPAAVEKATLPVPKGWIKGSTITDKDVDNGKDNGVDR